MLNIRRVSPMVRSIGTMGVVMGLVGAVTFANLTSNVVALDPVTLDSATAHLKIGLTNGSGCTDGTDGPQAGFSRTGATALVPGVASTPFTFCLKNTGGVALNLTTEIPQAAFVDSVINPNLVTLAMTCDNPGSSSGTLDQYTGGTPLGTLAPGADTNCTATVTLSSSYSGSGGESVNPFAINFVGTQP